VDVHTGLDPLPCPFTPPCRRHKWMAPRRWQEYKGRVGTVIHEFNLKLKINAQLLLKRRQIRQSSTEIPEIFSFSIPAYRDGVYPSSLSRQRSYHLSISQCRAQPIPEDALCAELRELIKAIFWVWIAHYL